ncbi:hypothetical protein Apa02nite_099960 [Actinoplanes palleronii]|uniref:Uncharacterized protein n=1 Tax=Actinoplanes palleronii TaxID=113570 RepID=A0ABQ4BT76_9ACTN|nr:hypothetical protein Apa02nite_099960 [Actinoplanes palleronii]
MPDQGGALRGHDIDQRPEKRGGGTDQIDVRNLALTVSTVARSVTTYPSSASLTTSEQPFTKERPPEPSSGSSQSWNRWARAKQGLANAVPSAIAELRTAWETGSAGRTVG